MLYLLDSNTVIALLNDKDSLPSKRVRLQAPADVGISTIVVFELSYGAYKSQHSDRNVAVVDGLQFEILDWDKEDARQAGEVRAYLAKRGTPIGPYDVLLAGQARARNLTLVTHNTAEFLRVPDLRIEDWHRPPRERLSPRPPR